MAGNLASHPEGLFRTTVTILTILQKQQTGGETAESNNWLGYWLDGREIVLRYPEEARDSSLFRNVQTGSRAQSAYCSMETGGFFSGSTVAGTWSWKIRLLLVLRVSRIITPILHIPSRRARLLYSSRQPAWKLSVARLLPT